MVQGRPILGVSCENGRFVLFCSEVQAGACHQRFPANGAASSTPSPTGSRRLWLGRRPWPDIGETNAITGIESRSSRQRAEKRREAIALALNSKALVITGGPGVGKTWTARSFSVRIRHSPRGIEGQRVGRGN